MDKRFPGLFQDNQNSQHHDQEKTLPQLLKNEKDKIAFEKQLVSPKGTDGARNSMRSNIAPTNEVFGMNKTAKYGEFSKFNKTGDNFKNMKQTSTFHNTVKSKKRPKHNRGGSMSNSKFGKTANITKRSLMNPNNLFLRHQPIEGPEYVKDPTNKFMK